MRVYALYLVVTLLSLRAYRDYFLPLCALIALTAVARHPDWPTNVLGIQGFNPWNILLLNVLIAWRLQRHREGCTWDLPRYLTVLLACYGTVMLVSSLRLAADPANLEQFSRGYILGEYFINTFKWVVPGVILYDCCRTKERIAQALLATLSFYLILGVLVIKWVPPTYMVNGEALERRTLKVLVSGMGWHRVNVSAMLAGASWAVLSCAVLWRRHRKWVLLAVATLVYAQALTAGRMGYVAWGAVGIAMGALRWRKLLLLVPVVPVVIVTFVPAVAERMLSGVTVSEGQATIDSRELTASRTMIWPYVIAKIRERPLVGYGREAQVRTGLAKALKTNLNEEFAHPHNAYLQWMFDNGLVGTIPVALFYICMLYQSARLMKARESTGLNVAVGGGAFAAIVALLVSSMGSQTFYPREGTVALWAALGLMLRVTRMRQQETRVSVGPTRRHALAFGGPRAWRPTGANGSAARLRQPLAHVAGDAGHPSDRPGRAAAQAGSTTRRVTYGGARRRPR